MQWGLYSDTLSQKQQARDNPTRTERIGMLRELAFKERVDIDAQDCVLQRVDQRLNGRKQSGFEAEIIQGKKLCSNTHSPTIPLGHMLP